MTEIGNDIDRVLADGKGAAEAAARRSEPAMRLALVVGAASNESKEILLAMLKGEEGMDAVAERLLDLRRSLRDVERGIEAALDSCHREALARSETRVSTHAWLLRVRIRAQRRRGEGVARVA